MVQTNLIGDKGGYVMALTPFTLNLTFEVISSSKWFFIWKHLVFTPDSERAGNFTFKIILRNFFQGHFKVKSRSNSEKSV